MKKWEVTFGLRRSQKVLVFRDLGVLGIWGQENVWRLESGRPKQRHHVFVISTQWGLVPCLEQSAFAEIFLIIAPFWSYCRLFC
jgi:hypothetical protein